MTTPAPTPRPGTKSVKRVTAAELARLVGVSRSCVTDWQQAPHFPQPTEAGFDILETMVWWLRREGVIPTAVARRANGPDHDDLEARKEAADVRKAEADAARRELKLAFERGQLVDRAAVAAEMTRAFHAVRSRLEAIPEEITASVDPENRPDVLADARDKIRLVLLELESHSEA